MTRWIVLALVLVVGLPGCPKRPTPESTLPPKATPQQCEQVADHLVGLMVQNIERDDAINQLADRIRRVMGERCTQDGWGPDATDCFSKLQSMGEKGKEPCEEFLSIEQRDNVNKAIADLFDPPAGSGSAAP